MGHRNPFVEGLGDLGATLHISHRGGAALAPENTLVAFDNAVGVYGTDMLELDTQASADGVLVVAHDASVDRCTNGTGLVSALSWAELCTLDAGHAFGPEQGSPYRDRGVRLPRLEEVLERFPGTRLNIELKAGDASVARQLVETLRRFDALNRSCIGSEDDALATLIYEAAPEACHFYPAGALEALVVALKTGQTPPPEDRFSVLDMPFLWQGQRLIDQDLLQRIAERGQWVNAWTVDDEAEMRYLVESGVGGVMTDRPDRLRVVLSSARK